MNNVAITLSSLQTYFPANTWTYFAITRDSTNNVQLYLAANGTSPATLVVTRTVAGTINSTNAAVFIGATFHTGGTQRWTGFLDQIRVVAGVAPTNKGTVPFTI